ncbi:MAG TPA: tripartite tricarboxylate transporter substrate-binding protein [Xanthobacteraceae bacterium]|nr:tripartite tricarboxylate transporter substrate-binding protein [Xanthobacteraceae bacterium]
MTQQDTNRRRFLRSAAGLLAAAPFAGQATAQSSPPIVAEPQPVTQAAAQASTQIWPSRTIRLVVAGPPDGDMDRLAHVLSEQLSEIWSQPVTIDDQPGAGTLALDTVAQAPADGYTMLIAAGSPDVDRILFSKQGAAAAADLAPITLLGTFPNIIAVARSSPFQSVEELIAYARRYPGKISWASPGVGTPPHLAGELFKRMAGLSMMHVPYNQMSDDLLHDLIGGRVNFIFDTAEALLPPLKTHEVRGLAVTSGSRYPNAPDLPTVEESGLPGYDISSWYGLYLPANTPEAIVQRLNADVVVMLRDTAMKEKVAALGIVVQTSSPKGLADRNLAGAALWGPLIATANIKVQ